MILPLLTGLLHAALPLAQNPVSDLELGGRLMMDSSFVRGGDATALALGDPPDNVTEIRRTRKRVRGVLPEDWDFHLEFDFASSSDLSQLSLSRDWWDGRLRVGCFKQSFNPDYSRSKAQARRELPIGQLKLSPSAQTPTPTPPM